MPLCDVTTTIDNGYIEMQPLEKQDARHVLQHHQAPAYLVVDPAAFGKYTSNPPVAA